MFFFSSSTPTTEIYPLSLHDALPISGCGRCSPMSEPEKLLVPAASIRTGTNSFSGRSEEHTSELQSPDHLACRPLLEKKKQGIPSPPAFSIAVSKTSGTTQFFSANAR